MSKHWTRVLVAGTLSVGSLFASATVDAAPPVPAVELTHSSDATVESMPSHSHAPSATTSKRLATVGVSQMGLRRAGVGDWGAYFRCVAGIGVPLGVAIAVAMTMPAWLIGYLAGGSWSAERIAWSLGFGGVAKYAKAIGRSCMQFIRS